MYEIVERSIATGEILHTYSGYASEEEAQKEMEMMHNVDEENDDDSSWYEVRKERG